MYPAKPSFDSAAERSAWFLIRHPDRTPTLCETSGLVAIAGIQRNLIGRLGRQVYADPRNQPFQSALLHVTGRIDEPTLKALWIAAAAEMRANHPQNSDAEAVLSHLALAIRQHAVTPLVLQTGLWLAYGAHGATIPMGPGEIGDVYLPPEVVLPRFNHNPPVALLSRGVSMWCRTLPAAPAGQITGTLVANTTAGQTGWTETAKRALRRSLGLPAGQVPWNTVLPGQRPPPKKGCG